MNTFPVVTSYNDGQAATSNSNKSFAGHQLAPVSQDILPIETETNTPSCAIVKCPRCAELGSPEVSSIPTAKTHLIVLVLGIIGLVGLMFLPYLIGLWSKPVKRCKYCGDILEIEEESHPSPVDEKTGTKSSNAIPS